MKRFFAALMLLPMIFAAGCEKKTPPALPEVEQIRSICELATLKCYYNNVAKTTLTADHFWEKDREMWIEYEGVATIGIDMNRVSFTLDGSKITVTMPKAKLMSINVKEGSLNKDSYIVSTDGLLFKNPVTAERQQQAISEAQEKMEDTVRNNAALFLRAEQEAKGLIENYIKKLGDLSNTDYEIIWEQLPDAQ